MAHMLELFPFLAEVRVMRQWAGIADMTPDFSPIMGLTPVENYYIDAGWGTWGSRRRRFAASAGGDDRHGTPRTDRPFALDRFEHFVQIGERGAASVGH